MNLTPFLTDDLLKPEWRNKPGRNKWSGHCYVACEALFHLSGKTLKPHVITHEGGTHWFLKTVNGLVIDPTAKQFKTPVPYENGRGCGFLTKQASKRCQILLARCK